MVNDSIYLKLEMWANAQPDGRPAEYRWRPLFNAAVWLTPISRVSYNSTSDNIATFILLLICVLFSSACKTLHYKTTISYFSN